MRRARPRESERVDEKSSFLWKSQFFFILCFCICRRHCCCCCCCRRHWYFFSVLFAVIAIPFINVIHSFLLFTIRSVVKRNKNDTTQEQPGKIWIDEFATPKITITEQNTEWIRKMFALIPIFLRTDRHACDGIAKKWEILTKVQAFLCVSTRVRLNGKNAQFLYGCVCLVQSAPLYILKR